MDRTLLVTAMACALFGCKETAPSSPAPAVAPDKVAKAPISTHAVDLRVIGMT